MIGFTVIQPVLLRRKYSGNRNQNCNLIVKTENMVRMPWIHFQIKSIFRGTFRAGSNLWTNFPVKIYIKGQNHRRQQCYYKTKKPLLWINIVKIDPWHVNKVKVTGLINRRQQKKNRSGSIYLALWLSISRSCRKRFPSIDSRTETYRPRTMATFYWMNYRTSEFWSFGQNYIQYWSLFLSKCWWCLLTRRDNFSCLNSKIWMWTACGFNKTTTKAVFKNSLRWWMSHFHIVYFPLETCINEIQICIQSCHGKFR